MRKLAVAPLLAVAAAGCGSSSKPLSAKGGDLPSLATRCGTAVSAKVGWFRASDGVLLDGALLGDGKRGVVLAHQSPADLCGWVPYARVLSRAGFRVLLLDHRHFGDSQSPTSQSKAGHFSRDLDGAVDELKRDGAGKVFLMGASFGGITTMVAGSRLGSKVAGVVSVSGEAQLGNTWGPNSELDALAAVPKLHVPFLILSSRQDGYLLPSQARELERRAGSADKKLVIFPGGDHGWDLLTTSRYRDHARRLVLAFLRRH
jgi:pimeloyl-ACP methyl ester carboxylesterase